MAGESQTSSEAKTGPIVTFPSSVAKELPDHHLADQDRMECAIESQIEALETRSRFAIHEHVCHILGHWEDHEIDSAMQETEPHPSVTSGLPPIMEHCELSMNEVVTDCSSVFAYEPAGEVVAWVDITTPMCNVVNCTPGFSALSGPSTDSMKLLEWMSDSQRDRFLQILQQTFVTVYHDGEMGMLKMQMRLTPPKLKRFRLSVLATIELVEMLFDDDDNEILQQVVMQFTFPDLSWIQGKAASGRRRSIGSRIPYTP